jgi:hypothetical protein
MVAKGQGPWDFGFSGSFISAEFDSTVIDSTGSVLGGVQEGNRLPSVPKYQLSASATYNIDTSIAGSDGGYITASTQIVGDRITQPGDQVGGAGLFASGLPYGGASGADITEVDLTLDAYQISNITAGLDFDTWELQAYVSNVFDTNTNLSFDRERGGRARLGFRTNAPRTAGITARFNY